MPSKVVEGVDIEICSDALESDSKEKNDREEKPEQEPNADGDNNDRSETLLIEEVLAAVRRFFHHE